ncbi:MAG: antibiotic biosynthesis monooxygenase [Nakamurella sp.]
MSITALLDVRFAPDRRDDGLAFLHQVLADTREFDGSGGVEVVVDVADPTHVMVIERWASLAHDNAYRAWRAGAGASPLGDFLAAPATLTRFEASALPRRR